MKTTMTKHSHLVNVTGTEEQIDCFAEDSPGKPCPFSEGTPEELGLWIRDGNHSMPFAEWLRLLRMPPASPPKKMIEVAPGVVIEEDVLLERIKTMADEGQTVPFVKNNTDGTKSTVGYASMKVENGLITAEVTLDAQLLFGNQLRLGLYGAESFSIGT